MSVHCGSGVQKSRMPPVSYSLINTDEFQLPILRTLKLQIFTGTPSPPDGCYRRHPQASRTLAIDPDKGPGTKTVEGKPCSGAHPHYTHSFVAGVPSQASPGCFHNRTHHHHSLTRPRAGFLPSSYSYYHHISAYTYRTKESGRGGYFM